MASYENSQLAKQLADLDLPPVGTRERAEWMRATAHLAFLQRNVPPEELIIYGSGPQSFLFAGVLSEDRLATFNQAELLKWEGTPFQSASSYVWTNTTDEVRLERLNSSTAGGEIEGAIQLVYGRHFEGMTGDGRSYFEVNQEYAHLVGVHWLPEQHGHCKFNEDGDLEAVISQSRRNEDGDGVTCISFAWEPLCEYLTVTRSVLIRRFDFTLIPERRSFSGWPNGAETTLTSGDDLWYRQTMTAVGGYTVGIQIVRPPQRKPSLSSRKPKRYAEFIVFDWRNAQVVAVSADPTATTNYFEASQNKLPFEMSPAFFRPEVISKYRSDKEKYTIGERDISCRAAWGLKAFDINEAGQVFAYLVYLRDLPYSEQQHWQSFNESPKAPISARAIANDFQGRFETHLSPLQEVLACLRLWREGKVSWWKLKDSELLDRVAAPLSASREEWADGCMDLSKLIIEGFNLSAIRKSLSAAKVAYTAQEQSILLLEKFIGSVSGVSMRLSALRSIQEIRSKIKGHSNSTDAQRISQQAVREFGSYAKHYSATCTAIASELRQIQAAFLPECD